MISSESRMRENRTSGLMSGYGTRRIRRGLRYWYIVKLPATVSLNYPNLQRASSLLYSYESVYNAYFTELIETRLLEFHYLI